MLTWPVECRRFLGAHEAAHAVQAGLPRRRVLIVLAVVMTGYLAFDAAAAIKFGFGEDLLQLAIEATMCTGMIFLALIETVLYQCRRLEYQANQAAAAAVGTAGIIRWQHIAHAELSQTTRTMLAINAATRLRTHPTWRRRISAVTSESTRNLMGAAPTEEGSAGPAGHAPNGTGSGQLILRPTPQP